MPWRMALASTASSLKMTRIVRDMTKKLNRPCKLTLVGENTEVDKTIVDNIGDPIMHMVRNSMDHGIEETQEERVAAGKDPVGEILRSARDTGSEVIIEIIAVHDGHGQGDADGGGHAVAQLAGDGHGAAQLLHAPLHHVHAHAPAGELGVHHEDLQGRRDPRLQPGRDHQVPGRLLSHRPGPGAVPDPVVHNVQGLHLVLAGEHDFIAHGFLSSYAPGGRIQAGHVQDDAPILDICSRMGLPSREEDSLVVVINLGDVQLGILVDGVDQMLDIPRANIHPLPANSAQLLVSGMCSLPRAY